jgi:dephospho-CoA kinase
MSSSCFVGFPFPSSPGRWKHGAVPVIALTGGIGSGKSRVAELLRERGAVVIDADAVGHEVLEQPAVRRQVIERFGPGMLRPDSDVGPRDGRIDRKALGSVVFADRAALHDLEAILHPRMRRRFAEIIEREAMRGQAPAVVLDAAILLEAGWDNLCDLVVFVDASLPVRLERVARGRGWTAEVLQARETAQWPCDAKRNRGDVVLHNESSLDLLEQDVDRLFRFVTDSEVRDSIRSGEAVRFVGPAPKSHGPVPALPGDGR